MPQFFRVINSAPSVGEVASGIKKWVSPPGDWDFRMDSMWAKHFQLSSAKQSGKFFFLPLPINFSV